MSEIIPVKPKGTVAVEYREFKCKSNNGQTGYDDEYSLPKKFEASHGSFFFSHTDSIVRENDGKRMKKSEYTTMAAREQTYWWHVGRLRIIETYLKRATKNKRGVRILNVGSGTGGTIGTLEKFGQVDNVDISETAIAFAKQKGYKRITKIDGLKLPFKDQSYDIVVAFDVLEHIEDQDAALKEWRRVIKDTGSIILTVPAYQWLWSGHDESLHHKRRYTKKSLQRAARQSNLKEERLSYAIVFSLPMIIGFRFMRKLARRSTDSESSYVNIPAWMNRFFINLLFLEARAHERFTFPAGTSIVTILRKRHE